MRWIFVVFSCVWQFCYGTHAMAGDRDIRLVFGGDVTLAGAYGTIVPDAHDPGWPFRRLQGFFRGADVVMVNCEAAITRSKKREPKRFNFKMDPGLALAFLRGGITLVTLANNHVYDYGAEGLRETLLALDAVGVEHVGAGMTLAEARRPVSREIKGKQIVFLGYGNYAAATERTPGTAYRHLEHVVEDVRLAKRNGADIVVVNFHWGMENATKPTDADRALAYLTIEAGADVIVGHHPHVLQPTETYRGKTIAWSLGNFVFGGNRRPGKESALLDVSIAPDGILSYRLVPIRIDTSETRYQPYVIEPVLYAKAR